MKIIVERETLFSQLQTAARVASARTAIQALSGVHCRLSRALRIARDRYGDWSADSAGGRDGSRRHRRAAGPPLLDIVRSLPGARVSLELSAAERDVELISGSAVFHIRTLRSEDFPPFPEPEDESEVSVPAESFISTALKVAGSASRDDTRPVLTGILISAERPARDGRD